jgi:acyl-CoA hydrolase
MSNNKRETVFRFLAEPTDVNFGGKVHGGSAMKWIDQAAYACAAMWSGRYCVTVSVGSIRFHRPIRVGELVEVSARIAHTGKTSMHISVSIKSGPPTNDVLVETNHCIIVFVATDESGNTVPVKKWTPITEKDKVLEQYAIDLKNFTQGLDKKLEEELDSLS